MSEDDGGFDPDAYNDPDPRRPRGYLMLDVNNILREYVVGELVLPDNKFMTPYVVSKLIKESHEIDKRPSSGAVDAVFKRFESIGYATFRRTPYAFLAFTDLGKELGLQGFLDQIKNQSKSEK